MDVTYRPLRIGWALTGQDIEACRQAARLNYTLWGGRFNPLLPVDRPAFARQLVDAFRVDVVLPIGTAPEVTAFVDSFPYLLNPFEQAGLFIGGPPWETKANALDVHNLLTYQQREHRELRQAGVRQYYWCPDDPLADMFLLLLGQYPPPVDIQIDYEAYLRDAARPKTIKLDRDEPISPRIFGHPTIEYFSRHGLERHYSVPGGGWDLPGFFLGTLGDPHDFLTYWNIRAADVPLLFVDSAHSERYARLLPEWHNRMRPFVSQRRKQFDRQVAVWSHDHDTPRVLQAFNGMELSHCRVSDGLWNGLNIVPPTMYLKTVSTLGIVSREQENPRVSFALNAKPFSGDVWFHTQLLVASVSFLGNPLSQDDLHTLRLPYLPELNEYFGRAMHTHDSIRAEPTGDIGIIINAADTDRSLTALSVNQLFDKVFGLAGYTASPSSAGLLTRQIISVLGGLQGGRAFKIPGVRRLLKTYSPTDHFTKKAALQLIGGPDTDNPAANFSDHKRLFIEQRPIRENLTVDAVFAYLVEKGIFRIGRSLTCAHCGLASWTSVDALRRDVRCELCGHVYDPARQLVRGEWDYRRSGLLGVQKNIQGAVPVVLTLQQLDANLSSLEDRVYSISLDLKPNTENGKCEIDFAWMILGPHRHRMAIVLGECKDRGPISPADFERDVETLRRVADALSRNRLRVFTLVSKLSAFSREEVAIARRLNDDGEPRAILLTERELEPYRVYERTTREFKLENDYTGSLENMASVTQQIYFQDVTPDPSRDKG